MLRNRYVLAADVLLLAAAAFGAFALRFDWFAARYRAELVPFVVMAVVIKTNVYYWLGMYRRYWAYASVRDLMALVCACTAASVAVAIAVAIALLIGYLNEFSRSVLMIDWALTLLATGGLRFSVRLIRESRMASPSSVPGTAKQRRILVAGAGDAGGMVTREMQKNPHLGMLPLGFMDDDRAKIGKRIYGLPVFGGLADLSDIVNRERVDEVVIAMPKAPGPIVRRIAEDCLKVGVTSRTVPGVYELLDGRISVSRLRDIEIADLLRRRVISGADGITDYLTGRSVLVTGAGGSIGSELCRQVARAGPSSLVLLGHGENSIYDVHAQLAAAFPHVALSAIICDVRDRERIESVFTRVRPDVVFHAAAHKHVPLMEANPEEAVSNNVIGTRNVADAALKCGTQRFVLISTDKAVAPSSVMGASKRVAEAVVRARAERHGRALVVVRFGNVLGSRGSVVPVFKAQIERGGPISITHPDMMRFFMTIPEAVDLVLHAGGLGRGGELFVLNMGQPVKIVDLANDLIGLSGLSATEIPIVFTGLRPGEKLEERLWEPDADVAPTSHPDILRVTEPDQANSAVIEQILRELEEAVGRQDPMAVTDVLARWLPTFAPFSDPRLLSARHPA